MMPTTIPKARSTVERAITPGATYKVAEAALMVGLHKETIHRRIRAGKLKAWGSPQRVAIADLLAPNTRMPSKVADRRHFLTADDRDGAYPPVV
jgi:hypothetical protein